jgi:hypothetical protein
MDVSQCPPLLSNWLLSMSILMVYVLNAYQKRILLFVQYIVTVASKLRSGKQYKREAVE